MHTTQVDSTDQVTVDQHNERWWLHRTLRRASADPIVWVERTTAKGA